MNHPWAEAARALSDNKLVVLPTDTIYGLAAKALSPLAIGKLNQAKGNRTNKPYIIAIASINQLQIFQTKLSTAQQDYLRQVWPGPTSVILTCPSSTCPYLHQGKNTLAFRLPTFKPLIDLIDQVGPLAIPSSNPSGAKPATSIAEAVSYFGPEVAVYVKADQEPLASKPSTLIDLTTNPPTILRS